MKSKGFTLIELVLMIGLLVLTAGVSSDIIITLIRSYNKTQVTNEIEQSADFVLLKLEKELRNSAGVDAPASGAGSNSLTFRDNSGASITYSVASNVVSRNGTPLTDATFLGGGVSIVCNGNCFTNIGTGGIDVIKISVTFSQATTTGVKAFEGTVPINTTIVVRGSY